MVDTEQPSFIRVSKGAVFLLRMYKMDILKLIKRRKSIRKYQDKPIPKRILDKIIEAGIWGPSVPGR